MRQPNLLCILALLLLCGCRGAAPPPENGAPAANGAAVPATPASAFCTEQGDVLELRSDDNGAIAVCRFPDGSQCEEGAFARGECGLGKPPWGGDPTAAELTLAIRESYPIQVQARLSGNLPNTCARVQRIDQVYDPQTHTFLLTPVVGAVTASSCEDRALPFSAAIDLDVVGLGAGHYDVKVGDQHATFHLEHDNQLPGAGSGPAAAAEIAHWPQYTNPTYGFSVRFPPEWQLEETRDPAHPLAEHQLQIVDSAHPEIVLTIAYRSSNEALPLDRDSLGEGGYVLDGDVAFLGGTVTKSLRIFDQRTVGVYYDGAGEIQRGSLIFAMALDYCGPARSGGIGAAEELLADLVVMSVQIVE